MNDQDNHQAEHETLRACYCGVAAGRPFQYGDDISAPRTLANVQPSPAEVDFIRKALALGQQILTLRQAARCVAQRLVRDADEHYIQSLREKLAKWVPNLPITVILTTGMRIRAFGHGGISRGEIYIAVNYENLFIIDEVQAIRSDPTRREHSGLQHQIDMLLLYCGFGFANELLKLLWNALSKAEPAVLNERHGSWTYDGSWSLDMALFRGTIEGLQKKNERGKRDRRPITNPYHLIKLNKLGVEKLVFVWIDCLSLLTTRAPGFWPGLRYGSGLWSRLQLSDVWIDAVVRAFEAGELRALPLPPVKGVPPNRKRQAGRTPAHGFPFGKCPHRMFSSYRRRREELEEQDPMMM